MFYNCSIHNNFLNCWKPRGQLQALNLNGVRFVHWQTGEYGTLLNTTRGSSIGSSIKRYLKPLLAKCFYFCPVSMSCLHHTLKARNAHTVPCVPIILEHQVKLCNCDGFALPKEVIELKACRFEWKIITKTWVHRFLIVHSVMDYVALYSIITACFCQKPIHINAGPVSLYASIPRRRHLFEKV